MEVHVSVSIGGASFFSRAARGFTIAVFIVSFEAADKGIEGFGIVFGDIKFNAGGIESKHGGKGRVDCLADGFGIIDHPLEISAV